MVNQNRLCFRSTFHGISLTFFYDVFILKKLWLIYVSSAIKRLKMCYEENDKEEGEDGDENEENVVRRKKM